MAFRADLNKSTPGCPTSLLHFDVKNPRLENGTGQEPANDVEMIKALREVAALGELIASICANEYRDIEPIIVKGPEEGPFIVLEGNRRLASIKVILDEALAEECGVQVPRPVRPEVLASIKTVTIYRVASEEAARAFIGFKHINGPHRWESFAKARFVTQWYKAEKGSGISIDRIAEQLGDDNSTIRNMIAGMLVLEQATSQGFDASDRYNRGRFAFSHLYTALTRSEFVDFLGLPKKWSVNPEENPVPKASSEKLSELMVWLYGSKQGERAPLVRSQNPDLAHLGEVLENPVSLSFIRAGKTLAEARIELRPASAVLSDVMVEINSRLREAVQLASRAEGADTTALSLAQQIAKQGTSLLLLVKNNVEQKRGDEVAGGEG